MEISNELAQKLLEELKREHKKSITLKFKLHHLSGQLKSDKSKVFLQQGVLRRLDTLHHCASKIFELFPPNRVEVLNNQELADITVFIQAFVVNVYGLLDNIAWVCALEHDFPEPEKNKLKIGLFKKEFESFLPDKLLMYLKESTIKNWFNEYAKDYRDSTTHRIPPYIPPYKCTPEDSLEIDRLEREAFDALVRLSDLDLHNHLKEKQISYRKVTSIVALSLNGLFNERPPIYMHPQIICDLMSVHELLKYFLDGLNELHHFSVFDPMLEMAFADDNYV